MADNNKNIDALGRTLAALHFEADRITGDNPGVTSVKRLKFEKGTPEDLKKLVKYYKFYRFDRRVPKAYSAIDKAYKLYTGYDDASSPKWMLEALILGGCSNNKIAELCGLDKYMVAAYKKYYYNTSGATTAQVRMRCISLLPTLKQEHEHTWGYKIGVLLNGVEWFTRNFITFDPTEEDDLKSDKYGAVMYKRAKNGMAPLLVNQSNYNSPAFVEKANTIGATYSHSQKDKELAIKESRTGTGMSAEADLFMLAKIHTAMAGAGQDLEDIKVSAFNKNIPAEEELPI